MQARQGRHIKAHRFNGRNLPSNQRVPEPAQRAKGRHIPHQRQSRLITSRRDLRPFPSALLHLRFREEDEEILVIPDRMRTPKLRPLSPAIHPAASPRPENLVAKSLPQTTLPITPFVVAILTNEVSNPLISGSLQRGGGVQPPLCRPILGTRTHLRPLPITLVQDNPWTVCTTTTPPYWNSTPP